MHAPAPASDDLLHLRDGAVAILTLNRPEARNALTAALIADLRAAFAALAEDTSLRAVVIAGIGPAFCAGHDLREVTALRAQPDGGRAAFARLMAECSAMMQAIVALPVPVIAAVGGVATAAGCQLVATCDLAVASRDAKFATPGVDIGLFCTTPMVALTRNVPAKLAMEMLLIGEPIGADEALRIGLVNRVVAPGMERDAALALARTIAEKSPQAIRLGKAAFHRQRHMPLADAYALASQVMADNLMAADAHEGIGAFLDKRPPRWPDQSE